VLIIGRQSPLPILRDVSWGVLPLVAGLFILVAGMNQTGVLSALAQNLHDAAATWPQATSWIAGVSVAAASNLINNLPVGLIAGATDHAARVPAQVTGAMLIGIDLGPNLSATGSLATVLWLIALRREGESITSLRFLKLGLIVMPPALLVSLLVLLATSP
jgi:arsenical pump membrane protein